MDENGQERERQYHWERFRERALAEVRRGYDPECLLGCVRERLLQIVHLPSFEAAVGWEVFELRCGDPIVSTYCLAHRTAWKQDEDIAKFFAPQERLTMLRRKFLHEMEPTLATSEVTPDRDLIQGALSRLIALRIPLAARAASIGIDGESYELSLGDAWAQVTLRCWEEAITRELLQHLEELFEKAEKVHKP